MHCRTYVTSEMLKLGSTTVVKGKGSPYSIAERGVPELIPVLGSQHAGDVSHKPGGRLPLLSARPAVTPATQFCCLVNRGTMGVSSLPKTVTRQRRGCDLNPGPSAPESSALTTVATEPPSGSGQRYNKVQNDSFHADECVWWQTVVTLSASVGSQT